MQHVIRKQTITLFLPGTTRAAAFNLQQALSRHYWQEILPEIEKVFDASSNEGEVIGIDRLEIDLGQVTVQMLTQQRLPASLLESIHRQLQAGVDAAVASGKVQPVAVNIYGHWLFYMQNGYVPWNAVKITSEWYQKVLEALATDVESVTSLIALLQTDPILRYRVIQQHKPDFLINLAAILVPKGLSGLPVMIREMTLLLERLRAAGIKLPTAVGGEAAVHVLIWDEILQAIARKQTGLSYEQLARIILEHLEDVVPVRDRSTLLRDLPSRLTILQPVVREWEEGGFSATGKAGPLPVVENNEPLIREDGASDLKDDTIFVQQAGVVLLHPFLNQFFSRLRLVEAGLFVNHTAKQKALYLIHYLATADGSAEEHELVMPKLLCGYPFHVPVEADVYITEFEREEADLVLEEAIRQWTVLKSTTVDGLREGFLKRPGKLSMKNGHWRLQVEGESIDVLLDQLPWNLSVIKLPWMKEVLMVEWR